MNLMRNRGLTLANSGLVNISIMFSAAMPKSCCSNFNSVQNPLDNSSPPSLKLAGIDQQRTNLATDPKLAALLNSPDPALSQYNYIVNTTNYAFVGDGTGSNIALTSKIYDPEIVSDIHNIDYSTLKSNHIRASDHMPVVSTTSDPASHPAPAFETTEPKRQRSEKDPEQLPEISGGYRKKRRSQRKLKQRKSKRHTKKRNYRKIKSDL